MKADVVIIDGMFLDAITSENKKLHKELAMAKELNQSAELKSSLYAERIKEVTRKLEQKIAECVELSKKCVYYDKLVDELIKENNVLHKKIKKQEEREEDIWDWLARNLPAPSDINYDDMEEFN